MTDPDEASSSLSEVITGCPDIRAPYLFSSLAAPALASSDAVNDSTMISAALSSGPSTGSAVPPSNELSWSAMRCPALAARWHSSTTLPASQSCTAPLLSPGEPPPGEAARKARSNRSPGPPDAPTSPAIRSRYTPSSILSAARSSSSPPSRAARGFVPRSASSRAHWTSTEASVSPACDSRCASRSERSSLRHGFSRRELRRTKRDVR